MNKICLGCGKILQNTNEKELGYTNRELKETIFDTIKWLKENGRIS